ncbi:prepilin-type N-terminal cleavage/methylation domain-containing protein, partial [Candidatus Peregrinibacteria bacterium]|nr:prepilin-type N-terminal cleavage/methylation domain-containing protein [Candidatus Peregrinibacteria bacterium]
MNIRGLKRGFTLVELLIVVAILAILSGAAYIGIQRSQARVMNEKVMDDLLAISNALEQYKQDNGNYPTINKPLMLGKDGGNMNVNCFNADTTYAHDCVGAAFLQAQIDNNLLTKRYLQEVPLDPRTHSRYVYGVTVDGQYFQVAGNYLDAEDKWIAKVRGNVKKGYQLSSLIRAFDGDNFVKDGEGYLPYSPDHLSLTATLDDINGTVKVDGLSVGDGTIVKPGSTIEADPGATVIIYFSDGSVTHLNGVPNGAELRVLPNTEVQQNDEDGIITKIRLKLFSGKIWSKVARLASESEFNVETTTAIAGVRGTEFG